MNTEPTALRPDQIEAKASLSRAYAEGAHDLLLLCPTGWGKTRVASDIGRDTIARGLRMGFFTDRQEIARDTVERFRGAGIRTGLVMANAPADPDAPVQVVSVPTACERSFVPRVDLAIWDECHHLGSRSWAGLFAATKSAGARCALGLTATAERGDGTPLSMFERIVPGPSIRWCTEHGLIAPTRFWVAPDLMDAGVVARDPVDAYLEDAPGSRALVFADDTAHAASIVSEARMRGVRAEALIGDTLADVRRSMRARVTAATSDPDHVRMLVVVGIANEGFDLPAIETVVLARRFNFVGGWLQAIGRGLRLSHDTGKVDCFVMDLCGSIYLHGLYDAERTWSLTGRSCVRTDRLEAVSRCASCGAVFPPARECPRCHARVLAKHRVKLHRSRDQRLENIKDIPQWQLDERALRGIRHGAFRHGRLASVPEWKRDEIALRMFIQRFGRAPTRRESAA